MSKCKYPILTIILSALLLFSLRASAVFDTGGGSAGGPVSWNDLVDVPPGFLDGIDNVGASGTEGTMKIIKINGVQIGAANITTLDFLGSDFDCVESPTTEINCSIDVSIARIADLLAHESDTTNIHGIANTANLLTTSAIGTSVQAFDSDLAALAAGPSANKITVVPFGTIGATDVQAALQELSNEAVDAASIHDNQANEIAPILDKATPVAADHLLGEDSAAGNAKIDITVGSLTSVYATDAELAAHNSATTSVHGIANTSALLTSSSTLPATQITFADPDNTFTATQVGAALAELNDLIGGGLPNQSSGKVHWSQLVGVPSGFADNDDGTGSSAGTLNTIKLGNAQLGAATIVALDFANADFSCSESPLNEINCSLTANIARQSDISTHNADTTAVHGIADTSTLLTTSSPLSDINIPSTITRDSELASHETDTTNIHGIADTSTLLTSNSPTINTPVLILEDGNISPPTVDGRIKFNRTTERLQVGDGVSTQEFVPIGTLTDARLCSWDAAGAEIDCNIPIGGTGTLNTIKENDVIVGGGSQIVLDFLGADFDCSESPPTEVNCSISAAITRDSELAAHEADTTNVHGITDTSTLLTTSSPLSDANIPGTITRDSELLAHEADTTNIHGIADTSQLITGIAPTIIAPILTLENGAGSPPTADGRVKYDRTSERLQVGDGTSTQEFVPVGTLTNTALCVWDSVEAEIDCATTALALGSQTNGDYVSGATANQGLLKTGTEGATLGLIACANGEILKNSGGTTWVCAADVTGTGGSSNASALVDDISCAPGAGFMRNASDTGWICGGDVKFNTLTLTPVDDATAAFVPATAGESLWYFGPNNNSTGTDDDALEWRQSSTAGSNVRMTLSPTGVLTPVGDVAFSDPGNNFVATTLSAAINELHIDNTIGPNQADAKVHWSQLYGVPETFGALDDVTGTGTTVVLQESPTINTPIFSTSATLHGNDVFITFEPILAGESQWWIGVNHDGGGDNDDLLEIRQSATPGTNVRLTLSPSGQLAIPGSTVSGGVVELCEDADGNVNDCVGFRVPDGLNLPAGSFYYDFNANRQLPATLIAGSYTVTANKSTSYVIGTDNAGEPYGGVLYATAAMTYTAPLAQPGMSFTVLTVGNFAVSVDVNGSDSIVLDGILPALSAGFKITNTSSAGDMAVCTYMSANTWYCATGSNDGDRWTSGGGS